MNPSSASWYRSMSSSTSSTLDTGDHLHGRPSPKDTLQESYAIQQSAWRNCPKSPGGTRNAGTQGTQTVPFGPFWPRYAGQIHSRSVTRTPFRTVSEGEFSEVHLQDPA